MGNLSDSGLTARKIGASPCHILGTPAYFERFGEPATPADLLRHQAVIYTQGEGAALDIYPRRPRIPDRASMAACTSQRRKGYVRLC